MADFKFEQPFWSQGRLVAGLDEVGRGAFAGPVVAACVALAPMINFQFPILNQFSKKIIINDSKKLTALQRERAAVWIKQNALFWGVDLSEASVINKMGIVPATNTAYRKILNQVQDDIVIEHLLLDAFYIPYLKGFPKDKQTPIIKGDQKSVSIAAASIIAKVYRDNLMYELGSTYPEYYWQKNKGYGTTAHCNAIAKHGVTKHHRSLYIRNINYPVY